MIWKPAPRPPHRQTDYEYDNIGRLVGVTLPPVSIANPAGSEPEKIMVRPRYEYGYDIFGNQKTVITNAYFSDATQSTVYLSKGTGGADTIVSQSNAQKTSYAYDNRGREKSRTLPLGQVEQEHYNDQTLASVGTANLPHSEALGQMDYSIDFQGHVTQFWYDNSPGAGGRLVEKVFFNDINTYPNTPLERILYKYDALGRQTQVIHDYDGDLGTPTDEDATNYTYINLKQMQTEFIRAGGTARSVFHEYDDQGRLKYTWSGTLDKATSTAETDYSYDVGGRMRTVEAKRRNAAPVSPAEIATYYYDKVGNLDMLENANHVITDYIYDELNRLTHLNQWVDVGTQDKVLQLGTDQVKFRADYDLNDDGTRKSATEYFDGGQINYLNWQYDNLGRLTSETRQAGDGADNYIVTYAYDLVGNRLMKSTREDATAQEISDFNYNGSFNWTQKISYTYDDDDRLIQEVSDEVDPLGQDTSIQYGYTGTELTSKMGWDSLTPGSGSQNSSATYSFNLQGQMKQAVIDDDGPGNSNVPVTFDYAYNDQGIRIEQKETPQGGSATTRSYVIDSDNPTGFAQVIEEYVGALLNIAYTIGLDVLAQTAPAIGPPLPSGVSAGDPLFFLY